MYRSKILYFPKIKLRYSILLLFIPFILSLSVAEQEQNDLLVFSTRNPIDQPSPYTFMVYNPHARETTTLHNEFVFYFSVSHDGHLAYSLNSDGGADIFLRENISVDSSPINITQNLDVSEFVASWSLDSRYLALESITSDRVRRFLVWDGTDFLNITPDDLQANARYSPKVSWSPDGRLAFQVYYADGKTPSEIYLWDGQNTINLSQNPTGDDRSPSWNSNSELAFVSENVEEDISNIYIWDGISLNDGLPDRESFIQVAPEISKYRLSDTTWTQDNKLMFQGVHDTYLQIYLWDGEGTMRLGNRPQSHVVNPQWSNDGRWTFSLFSGPHETSFQILDSHNETLLTFDGGYPAWSADGGLAFCRVNANGRWNLNYWEGEEVIEIAQGSEIIAQWQSGARFYCTSG